MYEISEIKEVFNSSSWKHRLEDNPRRIYGFLLCSDEHEEFQKFIQKAWGTLHYLSGQYCDIFTFEKWEIPDVRFRSKNYLRLQGGNAAGIGRGDGYGYSDQNIAIDNGIMIPNRVQCYQIRDLLFENPKSIILPGMAIFTSPDDKESRYYCGQKLSTPDLSEQFQLILNSIRNAYDSSANRSGTYNAFVKLERIRKIKSRLSKAILNLSLKDIIDVLTNGIKLVTPKSK